MARVIRSEAELAQILARPGFRVASQIGGETVNTDAVGTNGCRATVSSSQRPAPSVAAAGTAQSPTDATPGSLVLPWPPTGNHAVKHTRSGGHYLTPEVIAYRDTVANICRGARVAGQYHMHVHFSPPDRRARDMDNALKSLFDALRLCGYIESDAMSFMRELVVTVDDDLGNRVRVQAIPVWQ